MEILDKPVDLHYKNGKVFPPNAVFMGYMFILVALFILYMGFLTVGIITLLIALFLSFTTYGIEIHPETSTISEYTSYLGFIKIKKTFDYRKYPILTVVPTKHSYAMYTRSAMSGSYTNYYHSICLLNKNYRNKRDLVKFEQKDQSIEIAKGLAHRMNLEYFDYDPMVIREKMLGR